MSARMASAMMLRTATVVSALKPGDKATFRAATIRDSAPGASCSSALWRHAPHCQPDWRFDLRIVDMDVCTNDERNDARGRRKMMRKLEQTIEFIGEIVVNNDAMAGLHT